MRASSGVSSTMPQHLLAGFVAGVIVTAGATAWSGSDPKPAPGPTPRVVKLTDAPIRHVADRARVFTLATGREAFLARLEMAPGGKVPEHRDPTEEYLYIVQGRGTMYIDDVKYDVVPDTAIYMPAKAKVRFTNGSERLVAIQVFANPGPEAKYQKWKPGNWTRKTSTIRHMKQKIDRMKAGEAQPSP